MNKYANYRQEIKNEQLLNENLIKNSQIINIYKEKIDSISPKILANDNQKTSFAKFVSFNKYDEIKGDLDLLKNYANIVNDEKALALVEENIELIKARNLTKKKFSTSEFINNLKKNDPNYAKLCADHHTLKESALTNKEMLNKYYDDSLKIKLDEIKKMIENLSVKIKKHELKSIKKFIKYFYIVSLFLIVVIMIVLMICLFIY